jgi:hypothetical protein
MARMPPGLLRSFVLLTIIACSGCAEWHFRKDKKQQRASGSTNEDGALLPLAQDVANASLHGWNFNSRW